MLDRIRQKLSDGEPLTDEELALLEREAARQGGPTLRTAVAQALINADHHAQALAILEAVRRDFPNDVPALLALGRAQVSVERWREAEGPLRRVLELAPAHPEARAALAAVLLQRGEVAQARALAEGALSEDLLQSEAQQVLLEANRPTASVDAAPTVAEYTKALIEALRERSTPHFVQGDALLLKLGQTHVARLSLTTLHSDFLASGATLSGSVEAVAHELSERTLGLPAGRVPFLTRVFPVLREASFLERAVGAARREGPAGLLIFYVVDDPTFVRYVPESVLPAYRVSLEQLDTAAWRNLDAEPTPVRALELEAGAMRLSETSTGLWALAKGDGHDAARLLTASHQRALKDAAGPGPLRVYLGLRVLTVVAREDDAKAVEKLSGLAAAPDGIGGTYRLAEGRLVAQPEWDV